MDNKQVIDLLSPTNKIFTSDNRQLLLEEVH